MSSTADNSQNAARCFSSQRETLFFAKTKLQFLTQAEQARWKEECTLFGTPYHAFWG